LQLNARLHLQLVHFPPPELLQFSSNCSLEQPPQVERVQGFLPAAYATSGLSTIDDAINAMPRHVDNH
jgi:hypothetical protein